MTAPAPPPTAREYAAVVALSLLGCGVGAAALGADAIGDLLNYHFYNGYALLAGRLDQDIAPAGPASYFNPLLDSVHYLGIRRLAPMAFTVLVGAIQGLNVVLVWAIARRLLGPQGVWLAPLAAFLGATGQSAVSLLGTTFGDNTVSIPALAALLALAGTESPGGRRVFLAGAAGGVAVGLKMTMVAPHIGLGVLAACVAWRARRLWLLVAFGLGSLAGWGLTNGWWAFEMWQRFANPFFPLLNDIFQSPFAVPESLRDPRWARRELVDWLLPPIDAAFGFHQRIQERPFRDPRLLLVFLALVAWLVAQLRRIRAGQLFMLPGRGLVLYWLAAYGVWLAAMYYYRYATALEFLAPLVTFVLLREAWPRRVGVLAAVLAALVLLTTSVGHWGRLPSRSMWFRPQLPPLGQVSDQLILLPEEKTSFVIPFFPPDAAFIGLKYQKYYGPALDQVIAARLDAHEGPVRVLARKARNAGDLSAFGLVLDPSACDRARFGLGQRFVLCPLVREQGSGRLGP